MGVEFEAGLDRGVFYTKNEFGVAWPGLLSVDETEEGDAPSYIFIDGEKRAVTKPRKTFGGTINAFHYPREFEIFDGLTPNRLQDTFHLSYRTGLGNSSVELDHGYKIHLVYNVLTAPSSKGYTSLTRSSTPLPLSWGFTTSPIEISPGIFGSHLIVDTTKAYPWAVELFEEILYGSEETNSRMPEPSEIFDLFEDASILKITDNGDGTWTADAPDDVVYMTDGTTFEIDWPSAVMIDDVTYSVHSL